MADELELEGLIPSRRRGRHKVETVDDMVESVGEMDLNTFLHGSELQIRNRYKGMDLGDALRELIRIRKISEIASSIINQRNQPKESECYICHKKLPEGFKAAMNTVKRDEESGTSVGIAICSANCIKEWNKERMGLKELIK